MADSIWTAVSGAVAQARNVEVIANNLANADTVAFKKDAPTFREYLAAAEREMGSIEVPRAPIKDKDFYPLDGKDKAMVIMESTYTNFRQGNLRVTYSPLDIALDGPGFLEVNTPAGIRYTRLGSLKMAADGRLVTGEGHAVLATELVRIASTSIDGRPPQEKSPPPVASRFINWRDHGAMISISESGEIFAGDTLVAKLSVIEFSNRNLLRKIGGSLFENGDKNNILKQATSTAVKHGVIETSNVNPIEEMANLIKANRIFELNLKVLKTYGELKTSDLGKL